MNDPIFISETRLTLSDVDGLGNITRCPLLAQGLWLTYITERAVRITIDRVWASANNVKLFNDWLRHEDTVSNWVLQVGPFNGFNYIANPVHTSSGQTIECAECVIVEQLSFRGHVCGVPNWVRQPAPIVIPFATPRRFTDRELTDAITTAIQGINIGQMLRDTLHTFAEYIRDRP